MALLRWTRLPGTTEVCEGSPGQHPVVAVACGIGAVQLQAVAGSVHRSEQPPWPDIAGHCSCKVLGPAGKNKLTSVIVGDSLGRVIDGLGSY